MQFRSILCSYTAVRLIVLPPGYLFQQGFRNEILDELFSVGAENLREMLSKQLRLLSSETNFLKVPDLRSNRLPLSIPKNPESRCDAAARCDAAVKCYFEVRHLRAIASSLQVHCWS